jgi:phosphate acetyltransferase/phosphate butyryltransferase
MQATLDAKALVDLQQDNAFFPGALIEGPFGFDNAISAGSAATKGIQSMVSGDPDLLLVPDLGAGNILYKSLVYMAGAECAGVILGTAVPIILTSRSDSVFSRVASTALAMRLA